MINFTKMALEALDCKLYGDSSYSNSKVCLCGWWSPLQPLLLVVVTVSVVVVVPILVALLVAVIFVLVLNQVLGVCKVPRHFDQTSLSR